MAMISEEAHEGVNTIGEWCDESMGDEARVCDCDWFEEATQSLGNGAVQDKEMGFQEVFRQPHRWSTVQSTDQ